MSPLITAIVERRYEQAEKLIKCGGDSIFTPYKGGADDYCNGWPPHKFALCAGDKGLNIFKLLVEKQQEACLEEIFSDERDPYYSWSMLHIVVAAGAIEFATALLKDGFFVDYSFKKINHVINNPKSLMHGFTALMFACRKGNSDMIKSLLNHGADIEPVIVGNPNPRYNGMNAIAFLIQSGNPQLIDLRFLFKKKIATVSQSESQNRGAFPL